ncbi:MAG: hypothetical protein R3E79_23735 [Caldilineaceae bacterium]
MRFSKSQQMGMVVVVVKVEVQPLSQVVVVAVTVLQVSMVNQLMDILVAGRKHSRI